MAISHIPRSVGHNFVPEYQISAVPYNKRSNQTTEIIVEKATGKVVSVAADVGNIAVQKIDFPKITQWLQFRAPSAANVYFSRKDAANVSGDNCIKLIAGESTYPMNIRCTSIYFADNITTDLEIRAGLTSIDSQEFKSVVEAFLGDNIT
jgi:hypothetical protein